MNTIEVRCPVGPQKLFTKLKLGEEFGKYLPGNLIEFTCSDCAKRLGQEHHQRLRVYHCFNFIGELVHTNVEVIDEYCQRPGCDKHGSYRMTGGGRWERATSLE